MTWFINLLATLFHWNMSIDNDPEVPVVVVPPEPVSVPVEPSVDTPQPLPWDTPQKAYHGTRVLCDLSGLTVNEKNLICACIYQESQFLNTAKHVNSGSTDWGLVQINDYYHIGEHKDFPSVQYVLDNPDKAVQWMINQYKAGRLSMWVSYTSGAYHKWLEPGSPMWKLKVDNH